MYSSVCKIFIRNLNRILQNDFHLKSSSDKRKYFFNQSIWECNGHFDHWFSNTKAFLCSIWNLHREKFYPLSSSDLVLLLAQLHQLICGQWLKCYGNTFMRYLFIYLFNTIQL